MNPTLPETSVINTPPSRFPRIRVFLAQGLVIVVSVLVALAADRMVMGFDQQAQERTYLRGLLDDFRAIEQTTEYAMKSAATRDTSAVLVLATIRRNGSGAVSGLRLAKALELAGWVIDLQFARDTWDDMVGTGRLGILQDPELRREIAAFFRQTDQLHAFTRDWVQMARDYSDVVRGILDPELRLAIGTEFIYGEPIASNLEPGSAALIRRISAEPAILSTIGDVLLINKVSARTYTELAASARRIRTMLSGELGEAGAGDSRER